MKMAILFYSHQKTVNSFMTKKRRNYAQNYEKKFEHKNKM